MEVQCPEGSVNLSGAGTLGGAGAEYLYCAVTGCADPRIRNAETISKINDWRQDFMFRAPLLNVPVHCGHTLARPHTFATQVAGNCS